MHSGVSGFLSCLRGHPPSSILGDPTGGYSGGVPVRIRAAMDQGSGSQLSSVRREPLRRWVCTHCPNGATVQKRAARGTSTLLARGAGCGPACVTSRLGRTSGPGDPRPNPQGAGTDRPHLLLSNQGATTNQHCVGYVPAWHLADCNVALLTDQAREGLRVTPASTRTRDRRTEARQTAPVLCTSAMASDHPRSRGHAMTLPVQVTALHCSIG